MTMANRLLRRFLLSGVSPTTTKFRLMATSVQQADQKLCDLENFKVVHLPRGLITVQGEDAAGFLQGLITNNMICLEHDCTSLYAMMLNLKGRVMCDLMLYKNDDHNHTPSFLIEVDKQLKEYLMKTLKKYKIRKKVNVADVTESYSVYAAFGCHQEMPDCEEFKLYRDPRLSILGWRIIADKATDKLLDKCVDEKLYKLHRYKHGVGEGPEEHIPEKSLPLECNLVYLNGVSFTKGCYIGQELTARSHHTGVIRKRLMPFNLSSAIELPSGAEIKSETKGKSIGVVRASVGSRGIALMRVAETLKAKSLYTEVLADEKVSLTAAPPSWWPDTPV